ncbi:MAG TPA: baseplate J/gp47 family protein [Terrimicrobiaceae bacterium]
MAEKDIIQSMILQLGQSQNERMPEELKVHFADMDERKTEDLLLFAKALARSVNYYRGNVTSPASDWTTFFPYDEKTVKDLLQSKEATTSPHLALLLSFLELYKQPQEILNRLTGRHLDFYYKDVLRLTRKAAVPDKAHVRIELKKQSPPVTISPADVLSAGKDKSGIELIYAPTSVTVINNSNVDSLRSIFIDGAGRGTVRYAPIANSSDGLGGKLPADEPKWRAFGHQGLPPAELGFAIASPVLRMREGERKITVKLTLNNVDSKRLKSASLEGAFDAYITGEKNWAALDIHSATLSAEGVLQFEFSVPRAEGAVIDYDKAIHGYSYTAHAPLLQLLLRPGSTRVGYHDFLGLTLRKAQVLVDVSDVRSLSLESDGGVLDPKKAFVPFGPQPSRGSRFLIGYDEALSKKLSELTIKIHWKDAPLSFSTLYGNYGLRDVSNNYFTAAVSFEDGGSWVTNSSGVPLFESSNASSEHTLAFRPGSSSVSPAISTGMSIFALSGSQSPWAIAAANALLLKNPVFSAFKSTVPEPRRGFITLSLEKDFLHSRYRQEYVKRVMNFSKGVEDSLVILNEPYTPTIQSISLSYKAHSDEVPISSTDSGDFSNPDVQFYHTAYFGQMREHGYQRNQFGFLTQKRVSLLPVYENEGELLIGFNHLNPGDSVSVHFQVAEGSADPTRTQAEVGWSVLCDNYWKILGSDGVVLDTTNQLLASGIVRFVIPAEATTQNTILPAGRVWLRAGIARQVSAVCQLIDIAANAVEVRFTNRGNEESHLTTALEAGRIGKLKNGLPGVKSVKQPYASFGGNPEETDDNFYRRVSERLRHKNRCITSWDYERIVLEAFPKVHKVKCIPHAKEGSWLAPGNVMIVVIPDLKNKNAVDPLQPRVDADTLSRVTDFVRDRVGMQVQVKVKSPSYQRVQLDFKVKFRAGFEFNFYSEFLKRQLTEFLSPWAFKSERDISFGGRIYKSVLLDFVEELDPVDYVTDFKMYSYTGSSAKIDVNEAQPESPDAILVSDYAHVVNEAD